MFRRAFSVVASRLFAVALFAGGLSIVHGAPAQGSIPWVLPATQDFGIMQSKLAISRDGSTVGLLHQSFWGGFSIWDAGTGRLRLVRSLHPVANLGDRDVRSIRLNSNGSVALIATEKDVLFYQLTPTPQLLTVFRSVGDTGEASFTVDGTHAFVTAGQDLLEFERTGNSWQLAWTWPGLAGAIPTPVGTWLIRVNNTELEVYNRNQRGSGVVRSLDLGMSASSASISQNGALICADNSSGKAVTRIDASANPADPTTWTVMPLWSNPMSNRYDILSDGSGFIESRDFFAPYEMLIRNREGNILHRFTGPRGTSAMRQASGRVVVLATRGTPTLTDATRPGILVYDLAARHLLSVAETVRAPVSSALAPESNAIAVGGDGAIMNWSLATFRPTRSWRVLDRDSNEATVDAIGYAPSGLIVALMKDRSLRTFNVATGAMRTIASAVADTGSPLYVPPLSVRGVGRVAYVGSGNQVLIYNLETMSGFRSINVGQRVRGLNGTPDGKWVFADITIPAGDFTDEETAVISTATYTRTQVLDTATPTHVSSLRDSLNGGEFRLIGGQWRRMTAPLPLPTPTGRLLGWTTDGRTWVEQVALPGGALNQSMVRLWDLSVQRTYAPIDQDWWFAIPPDAIGRRDYTYNVRSTLDNRLMLFQNGLGGGNWANVVALIRNPRAALPPLAVSTVPPTVYGAGQATTVTVSLRGVAPAGGTAVTLSSSLPATAAVVAPATVTAPWGSSAVTFRVRQNTNVTRRTPVTLRATTAGGAATAVLNVDPVNAVPPTSVTVSPTSLGTVSSQATVTVTLRSAAPTGGVLVRLSSAAPTFVNPTAPSVTVPPGQTRATFRVTYLRRVTRPTNVALTATTAGGAAAGVIQLR